MKGVTNSFCALLLTASLTLSATIGSNAEAASAQEVQFEEAAMSHLPGTWQFHHKNESPAFEITGTSTYFSDGTSLHEGIITINDQNVPVAFATRWSIVGNKMKMVITESSIPQAIPVGTESTDTIHELTSTVFRYTDDEEGMTITERRTGP